MRTFTMQGVAPNPNWQRRVKAHRRIEAEPVFQLTREPERHSPVPTFAERPSHPGGQGLSTDRIGARARWRPVVVRIAGLLALAGALFGSARIFGHSTARRQALSWATLGHADVVLGAVR